MVDDPAPGPRRPTRRLAALACVAALPFSACGVRPVPPPHAPASPAASPMPGSVPAPPTAVATPAAPPPSSAPPVPPVPPAAPGPVRYPPEQVHGPFAPEMVERWRRLAETRPGRDDRMFLKAGASGTLNQHFFTCFAARARPFPPVEWGEDAALASGAAWFHPPPGVRGRSDPFARRSRATEVSRTAGWALRGEPAPLETELEATDARFAVVAFGTNDMVMAGTPRAALTAYVNDLGRLVDRLLAAGTIPVVTGPGPRAHVPAIARWVRVFDAATRAIAEARQVPYLSLEVLHRPLVAAGLARDGMHANTYRSGTVARPCDFGPDGRQHGYNARNLETLRALDALRRSLAPGEVPAAPGPPPAPRLEGTGSRTTPFVVDALPFAHTGWLAAGGEPATYTLTLSEGQPRGLRVELVTARAAGFALDARGPGEPGRGPRFVQGTLAPGRWTFEVRRPMPPAAPHDRGARDYLLLIVPCDAGDPDCR